MTTKTNGEPPRIPLPQPGKKPFSVVTDDKGSPVLSLPYYLAWHKGTGTFYVGGTVDRVYLQTRDHRKAIHRFRQWVAQQGKSATPEVKVVIPLPETDDWDTYIATELIGSALREHQPNRSGLPDSVIGTTVEALRETWKRELRELIYSNPRKAAIELDCEPLALLENVQGLKPPPPSRKLTELVDTYLADRTLTPDEETNSKTWWTEFREITKAKTVCDLDRDSFKAYRRSVAEAREKRKLSPVYVRSRFGKMKTIVNHAIREVDMTAHERSILENVKLLVAPPRKRAKPVDIAPDELHGILEQANPWETALFLMGLNAAYTPIDCQRLEWSMIDFKNGTIRFDRTKSERLSREPMPRICSLWTRTMDALKAIRNGSEAVFVSSSGSPAHVDTMNDHFVECRKRAKLKKELTFKHLRKSALTAASNDPTVPDRQINLLAGHSTGIKEHYVVKRNVELACQAIERYYFGA